MNSSCCNFPRVRAIRFYVVLALVLAAAGTVLFTAQKSTADLTGPAVSERQISLVVSALVERDHLLKQPIDDKISERAMKTFLRSFDPMKVYFYQKDIDKFMEQRYELDNAVVLGNLEFPYKVFDIFLARLDERIEMVDELLATEFDFTKSENMVVDPDEAVFPQTREEALDRWRKRIKHGLARPEDRRDDRRRSNRPIETSVPQLREANASAEQ